MTRTRTLMSSMVLLVLVGLLMMSVQHASGQSFPTKPVTIVVPYSAGGGTDQVARILVNAGQKYSPVRLNVVPMPGAGGATGSKFVVDAEPDGYTINFGASGSHMTTPILQDVGYSRDDFAPVARVTTAPFVLVVSPDAPWNTLDEFVSYVKENPNDVSYSSPGAGSSTHIGASLLAQQLGFEWRHIPFNGGSEAALAVIGGHVDSSLISMGSAIGPIQAGQLKPLAFGGPERSNELPDVPTFAELGHEFDYSAWRAIFAPAGTPAERVAALSDLVGQIAQDPDFVSQVEQLGETVSFLPYDEWTRTWTSEWELMEELAPSLDQ